MDRDVPEADRLDYLTVVASLVAADSHVADDELAPLEALCRELDCDPVPVLASARTPDPAAVAAATARLARDRDLAVALLTDAVVIAFADGALAPGESRALAELEHALGLGRGQVAMVARYVESVVLGKDDAPLSRELAAGVAAERPGALKKLFALFRRDRSPRV